MPDEEDIYQDHVMDHYDDPYHRGPCATCTHAHEDDNPLCGDRVKLQLRIENDRIAEVWFEGEGCCISQASASMLAKRIEGATLQEANDFSANDMLALFRARLTPNRQKCCLLSWRVLKSALHTPLKTVAP